MYYIKEYYNALPYEKVVQTKLKGTDVYKRYVDITDNKNIDYSDIFENLESIKAIRKKDSALVISFDTKKTVSIWQDWQYVDQKDYIILFFSTYARWNQGNANIVYK